MAEKKRERVARRRRAIKNADRAFSLYIRERDHWKCCVCGKTKEQAPIQCGHLFTRGKYSTRWDPDNARAQCAGCNMRHERDPGPMTLVWLRDRGAEFYDELYRRHNRPSKFKTWEIEELADEYTARLEQLKAEREVRMTKELP